MQGTKEVAPLLVVRAGRRWAAPALQVLVVQAPAAAHKLFGTACHLSIRQQRDGSSQAAAQATTRRAPGGGVLRWGASAVS